MQVVLSLALSIILPISIARADNAAAPLELLEAIERERSNADVEGVGVVLVTDGELRWSGGFGVADRGTSRKFDHSTVFRIGSVTKMFTALSVLRAQEEGLLTLDDPVSKHLSAAQEDLLYENPWAKDYPLRIAHLLEHTGGLNGLSPPEFKHDEPDPVSLEEAFAVDPDSRRLRWPPGLHSSYTNTGAGMVAYLLEQVSGERFEDYVQRVVFDQLGMSRSTFFKGEAIADDLATGYDDDGEPLDYWHMIYRPFGAINSTLDDMARFLLMLLHRGSLEDVQIVGAQSMERMETQSTTIAARHGRRYGYGLANDEWLRDGVLFHGHSGEARGFLSHLGYTRQNDSGYFLMMNSVSDDAMRNIRALIEDWLIREAEPPSTPPVPRLSRKDIDAVLGRYSQVTYRFSEEKESSELNVFEYRGDLYSQLDTAPMQKLIPVTKHLFRRSGETIATIAIAPGPRGRAVFQGGDGNFERDASMAGP